MANPNYQLMKYQADNIPHFDGNPKQINRFIKSCENLLRNHQDATNANAPINICLLDTILSKLTGRAADLIASRIELDSWNSVKSALLATFSDQRSIDCLVQDLISLKPHNNETPQNFGLRLQDARSLLVSKLNATNEQANVKLLKINQYEDLALKTFINGLNYHMQLVVRLKNPNSLEQAISFALEEENFLLYRQRANNTNKTTTTVQQTTVSKPPVNTQPRFRPMFRPPQHLFNERPQFTPNFGTQTHFSSFGTQPTFGFKRPAFSGQSNFAKRPNFNFRPNFTQQNTQPQYFGNKTPSKIERLPKPEPMDTSSGNSRFLNRSRQSYVPQQNLFAQTVESETENYEYDDNPYESEYYDNPEELENFEGNNEYLDVQYVPDTESDADQNFHNAPSTSNTR